MRRLIIPLMLLVLSLPAQAQVAFTKPANAPTAFIQDYNVTIGIWLASGGLGIGLAEFELQPNGTWTMGAFISNGIYAAQFDGEVAGIGGPLAYIERERPRVNQNLSQRFPPIPSGPGPTASTFDQINGLLASGYVLKLVGGNEILAPR